MQKRRMLTIVLAIAILVIWRQIHTEPAATSVKLKGFTMGVVPYAITYLDEDIRDFQPGIDSILTLFNKSLSTYIADSEISNFNRNDTLKNPSEMFLSVLKLSKKTFEGSNGAFDPTIGPLVNAWGFGKEKTVRMDSTKIDSLKSLVGYEQISFNNKVVTKPEGVKLDFSASAKGYAVDLVAEYLEKNEISNYMVEIGGEVACKGTNKEGKIWKIGIQKPSIDAKYGKSFAITFVNDQAMATSGNYRNYYQENGKIVSHTLDPFTGYSVHNELLSATIFASDCGTADAYATACMVIGLNRSKAMIEKLEGIEAFFIYSNHQDEFNYYASPGVDKQIEVLD